MQKIWHQVTQKKRKGITVLTLVILISAIGLTLALEGLVISKNQVESNLVEMEARRAEQNALSCVDYAIGDLKSNTSWTPASLKPGLWLDASDASTFTLSGSSVIAWRDKSANNRNATQGDISYAPVLSGGSVNFDCTDDFMNVDLDFLATSSHSAFIVARMNGTYNYIYGATNGGAGINSLHVGFSNNTTGRMNFWGNDAHFTLNASFLAGQFNLLNYQWATGWITDLQPGRSMYSNGNEISSASGTAMPGAMSGGGRIAMVTGYGPTWMDIKEIVFLVSNDVSSANRLKMEGYLAHKWGLEANLPIGHPYKTQAPDYEPKEINIDATNKCKIDAIYGSGNDDRTILTSATTGNITKKKTAKINTLVPSVSIEYVRDQEESDLQDIPVIKSLFPVNGATGVGISDNLMITFSKQVAKGVGNIEIRKVSDDSLVESIDVAGALVTVNGSDTVTINPANYLTATTNLYVLVSGTAFKDVDGKAFAGIVNKTDWVFGTGSTVIAYNYWRFRPTVFRGAGEEDGVQLSELQLMVSNTWLVANTVTNPGGSNYLGEEPPKANDNDVNTKWFDYNKQPIIYYFNTAITPDEYNWGTAGDLDERDPIRWVLEASNSSLGPWIPIDDRRGTDQSVTTSRNTWVAPGASRFSGFPL